MIIKLKGAFIALSIMAVGIVFSGSALAVGENILGVMVDNEGITFQVNSSGCTDKDDFVVRQLETFPIQLELERIQQDHCNVMVYYGTKIKFTYDELELKIGSEFYIQNKLTRYVVK